MFRNIVAVPIFVLLAVMCVSCSPEQSPPMTEVEKPQPSILLVTLDTTRADSMGF